MSEFRMPSLGADMDAGTLVEWMKRPGDHVGRGDAIAAVETQKGTIDIEAYETGILDDIRVQVGQRVPVGTVLAVIRAGDEAAAATAAKPSVATRPLPQVPPPTAPVLAPAPAGTRVTPAARRRAQELHLDMLAVRAGPDGVAGLREIEAARGEPPPRGAGARPGLDMTEMRKAIAAAMARSWRDIPHYFVSTTIDVEPMLAWLERENAQRPVSGRLHYAAVLAKAVALALKAAPALNGHRTGDVFTPSAQVHLGIAVAMRGGGLIAPAILDADTLDLAEVMARLDDLVVRVRGGRLRSSEMTAATATFSNLGEDTADTLQPVIYPPQVAIVGCGRIVGRAWAEHAALSVRRTMVVTVGGDHRVSDGRAAARFLAHLDELLHHPERL
jgi:pyruvate dehydrogenase E2 component (dihydrolipoamide acetyltransferase)